MAFTIVGHISEYGLCDFQYGALYKVGTHGCPFIGLIINTHVGYGIETSQHDGKDVSVDAAADRGSEELTTETEHFFQWFERDRERGGPF